MPSPQPAQDIQPSDGMAAAAANPSQNDPPTPDADLPALDAGQVEALREVGREWGPDSDGDAASLPVDPSLDRQPEASQPTRRGRLVRVKPADGSGDGLEATTVDDESTGVAPEAAAHRIRRAVLRSSSLSSPFVTGGSAAVRGHRDKTPRFSRGASEGPRHKRPAPRLTNDHAN